MTIKEINEIKELRKRVDILWNEDYIEYKVLEDMIKKIDLNLIIIQKMGISHNCLPFNR